MTRLELSGSLKRARRIILEASMVIAGADDLRVEVYQASARALAAIEETIRELSRPVLQESEGKTSG